MIQTHYTHRDLVRDQIAHKETPKLPCTLTIEPPLQDKMAEELKSTAWKSKIINSIVQVGCFDSWDTMKFWKDDIEIDAYGSLWKRTEEIAQCIRPVLQTVDYRDYVFPKLSDFVNDQKMADMRKTIEANPDRYPICMIGAGFYELTWRLIGMEDTLVDMALEPEKITYIFDRLMELLYQFVEKACELPVEAIMVADYWCDQRGVIFGKKRWVDMFQPYYRELYALIHKKGKKIINHVCGSVAELIPNLIDIGLDVLESVQPEAANMNPYHLKEEYGKDLAFWGGLGCQQAVTFFTPEQLRNEINQLADKMSVGGGYILSPAKTLNITVPVPNATAVLDTFYERTLHD